MFEKFVQLLVSDFNIRESEITKEAELIRDLGFNSIELADLVMRCEEIYEVEISEDDASSFVTVGDVVNYLEQL